MVSYAGRQLLEFEVREERNEVESAVAVGSYSEVLRHFDWLFLSREVTETAPTFVVWRAIHRFRKPLKPRYISAILTASTTEFYLLFLYLLLIEIRDGVD
jgi:hypothetical protein